MFRKKETRNLDQEHADRLVATQQAIDDLSLTSYKQELALVQLMQCVVSAKTPISIYTDDINITFDNSDIKAISYKEGIQL